MNLSKIKIGDVEVLTCEGYKMFYGTVTFTPASDRFPAEDVTGTWLYIPETGCWYCNGCSYNPARLSNVREAEE